MGVAGLRRVSLLLYAIAFVCLLHGLGGWGRIDGGKEGLKAALRDHITLKITLNDDQIFLFRCTYFEQGIELFVLQCLGKGVGKCFPSPGK